MSTNEVSRIKELFSELEQYIKNVREVAKLENFVEESLSDEPVRHYFVWEANESPYSSKGGKPVQTLKATIITDKHFYEFAYSLGNYRYDVVPFNIFFRIEEIQYAEESLDGSVVLVMEVQIDSYSLDVTQSYLVKGEKVKELKEFLHIFRQKILK